MGGSAGPGGCVPVLRQGFICRVKDSGGRHSCLVEVSGGFLRPSLEETLAFNCSRSVREEEEAEVVGTYQIRFLLFFFCLSFVSFLVFFFFCRFPFSSLNFRTLVTLLCGDASASLTGFLLLRLAPLLRKVPKWRWWISCGGALLDRVCLSLARGFAAVYSGPGECSVEVCLVCWQV